MINIEQVPYNKFAREILAVLPTIPENMIYNYIRLACIEFCNDSRILKRSGTDDIIGCVEEYALDVDNINEVVRHIDYIRIAGEDIPVINEAWGIKYNQYAVLGKNRDTILLYPTPCTCIKDGLSYCITVVPTMNSCKIDEEIYLNYYETIVDCALSKLYMLPREWHDINLASLHNKLYLDKMKDYRKNKIMGYYGINQRLEQLDLG